MLLCCRQAAGLNGGCLRLPCSRCSVVQVSRFSATDATLDHTSGLLRAMGSYDQVGLPVCRDIATMLGGYCGMRDEVRTQSTRPASSCSWLQKRMVPTVVTRFWAAVPVRVLPTTELDFARLHRLRPTLSESSIAGSLHANMLDRE